MILYKILEVVKDFFMPLITGLGTVIATGLVVPVMLEKWTIRKVYHNYIALLSHFDKFCRSLGVGIYPYISHEESFEVDTDVAKFLDFDKNHTTSIQVSNWAHQYQTQFQTALNISRIKAGLESGKFYFSRYYRNNKGGELLAVLIIKNNTANIDIFNRGGWIFPNKKAKSKLQLWFYRIKISIFGYKRPDYSIMLV